MTLPFDKKYQTIARRLAVKHRERDRVSMLRPERAAKPATPFPAIPREMIIGFLS